MTRREASRACFITVVEETDRINATYVVGKVNATARVDLSTVSTRSIIGLDSDDFVKYINGKSIPDDDGSIGRFHHHALQGLSLVDQLTVVELVESIVVWILAYVPRIEERGLHEMDHMTPTEVARVDDFRCVLVGRAVD